MQWLLVNTRKHALSFPLAAICNYNCLFKENALNYKIMYKTVKFNLACEMSKMWGGGRGDGGVPTRGSCVFA